MASPPGCVNSHIEENSARLAPESTHVGIVKVPDQSAAAESVYLFSEAEPSDPPLYKIGHSAKPAERLRQVGGGKVLHLIPSQNAMIIERALHLRFDYCRRCKSGDLSGRSEWFELTDTEVAAFCRQGPADRIKDLNSDLQPLPGDDSRCLVLAAISEVLYCALMLRLESDSRIGSITEFIERVLRRELAPEVARYWELDALATHTLKVEVPMRLNALVSTALGTYATRNGLSMDVAVERLLENGLARAHLIKPAAKPILPFGR